MFKSEPRTILQFLATHFDLLKQLFELQVRNEVIQKSDIVATLREFGSDIETQLFDHKLLVEQNDDYIINEPYFVLFEFVLQQFKPLLPEEIEKFGQSIKALFSHITQGIHQDKNILLDRIEALCNEIKKFTNAVTNNTISLLNESRDLKANTRKIEYQDKIKKARYLIDYYIIPLNTILDTNHSQSIYNELLTISKFSNNRRFDYADEGIRRQFERLYNLLKQVVKDISQQSAILSNELLPLIERIKTESEYLQGFHYFLTNGNCYRSIKPPELLTTTRENVYNPFIYEKTKEYFALFKNEEDVYIREEANFREQWMFNKMDYKSRLDTILPVNDFFSWCRASLAMEKKDFDLDNFFTVTSLLFEDDYTVEVDWENNHSTIKTEMGHLIVPKLKIKKKDVSS